MTPLTEVRSIPNRNKIEPLVKQRQIRHKESQKARVDKYTLCAVDLNGGLRITIIVVVLPNRPRVSRTADITKEKYIIPVT